MSYVYAFGWLVVFFLLAMWSFAAWAFHAIAAWAVSSTGVLGGGAKGGEGARLPEWLAPWVPADFAGAVGSALSGLASVIESMLQWLPALSGMLSVGIWVIWALGCAFLLALGGVGTALVAWLRRRASRMTPPVRRAIVRG